MSEWNLNKGEWRDSKPFGNKIHDFIMQYPEWAVYLRRDNRFKCTDHWSQDTNSFKSFGTVDCDCWGLGVAVSGYLVPCRLSRGRNAEVRSDGEIRELPGYVDVFQDVIHFPRGVLPQINDIVLLCEWNTRAQKINQTPPKARPIRIHSIYIIKLINSYFQRELSHLSCGVESHEIQGDLFNSLILDKLTNLPVIDTESTWQQISYWSA